VNVLKEMERNPPIMDASGDQIFFSLQAGPVSYRYLILETIKFPIKTGFR